MEHKKKVKQYSILWIGMLALAKVLMELYLRVDPTATCNGVVNPTHPAGICLLLFLAFVLIPILFTINWNAKLAQQRTMVILSYIMLGHHFLAVLGYAVNLAVVLFENK